MLIKLEASAVADICIRMAREIQKCGQLNKSLLPKGKKKRSLTEKARTEMAEQHLAWERVSSG